MVITEEIKSVENLFDQGKQALRECCLSDIAGVKSYLRLLIYSFWFRLLIERS